MESFHEKIHTQRMEEAMAQTGHNPTGVMTRRRLLATAVDSFGNKKADPPKWWIGQKPNYEQNRFLFLLLYLDTAHANTDLVHIMP